MSIRGRMSLAIASIISAAVASPAFAGVVVTSGLVDVTGTAISGKAGSVDGPNTDDPTPVLGLSGTLSTIANAVAGPVPQDPILPVSFPGTTGVATASAAAALVFTPLGGQLTIDARISAQNNFEFMDGGGYLANSASYFKAEFTLDVDTPFSMTGTAAFNLQDPLAILRLSGPFGSPVFLTAADNGPFAFGGVLPAGNYLFEGFAAVGETPSGPQAVGSFSESGGVIAELVLVPTPAATALFGLGALSIARRRR